MDFDAPTGPELLQNILTELFNDMKTAATVVKPEINGHSDSVTRLQKLTTEKETVDEGLHELQTSVNWQRFSQIVQSFVQIQLDMLKVGQFAPHVINLSKNRQENQREIRDLSRSLLEKKNNFEKTAATHLQHKAQRCEIVENLQMRIGNLRKQTKFYLHAAKNCGEESRLELIQNHQKPLEMRQLKVQLLETNLENLLAESSYVQGQLAQCSAELRAQFESLQSSYTEEMKGKKEKLSQLSRKLEWMRNSHRVFMVDYEKITSQYVVIMEKKKQEEEFLKKQQEEERRREQAAFKIQRWFRFLLFRRRLKKSRKSRRRKNAKSDKQNEPGSRKTVINDGQQLVHKSVPESKKPSASKKPTANGRKSHVKNNRSDENGQEKFPVEIKDQSSQTDGRVPKSRPLY